MRTQSIKTILIVDDELKYREILFRALSMMGYRCDIASNSVEAARSLRESDFDLVISDIRMEGKDGLELMRDTKSIFPEIDFILMTAYTPEYPYEQIIGAGAVDFIAKPFNIGELAAKLERIKREREILRRLRKNLEDTINALTSALETRDPYTAGHQRRVSILAARLAIETGVPRSTVEGIKIAGLVHDLGKIAVPSEILTKPTRLKEMEMNIIREHPAVGFDILKKIDFPWPVADMVYEHHELLDGSGYPRGLSGNEIRFEARILTVADVVEAMSSHRPYRPALGINAALKFISENSGALFDADVVDACERLYGEMQFTFEEMSP